MWPIEEKLGVAGSVREEISGERLLGGQIKTGGRGERNGCSGFSFGRGEVVGGVGWRGGCEFCQWLREGEGGDGRAKGDSVRERDDGAEWE